jgi:hypothetical protein
LPFKQRQRTIFRVTSKGILILWRQVKVYATLVVAAGSMGAEGAEAPGAGVLEEGAEDLGDVLEGVGAGKIRDTSLGAYSFAFLKNSVISTKGQA